MEKYTGQKTIGEGTYGSVLRDIIKHNGECLLIGHPISLLLYHKGEILAIKKRKRSS